MSGEERSQELFHCLATSPLLEVQQTPPSFLEGEHADLWVQGQSTSWPCHEAHLYSADCLLLLSSLWRSWILRPIIYGHLWLLSVPQTTVYLLVTLRLPPSWRLLSWMKWVIGSASAHSPQHRLHRSMLLMHHTYHCAVFISHKFS